MAGKRKFVVIDGKKQCVKCENLLPFTSDFYCKDKYAPDGLSSRCKKCRYSAKREWEINNPEHKRQSERNYYASNRDKYIAKEREWRASNRDKDRSWSSRWAKNNPDKRALYQKQRYNIPGIKIAATLRARVRRSVKEGRAIYRDIETVLGYTVEQLKAHIETTFKDGMSWDNYSYHGWHIDHIKPVSHFKLNNDDGTMNLPAIRECWALSNLQALWKQENLEKSACYQYVHGCDFKTAVKTLQQ